MNNLITIAKRDNNTKRTFLLVNPLQGKHIPASPRNTINLVKQLSDLVYADPINTNCLVIGFAETATAIGALLAADAPAPIHYIHTTREIVPGSTYLFFSEEHSHATEQKLIKNTLDQYLTKNLRIIFAEDEVTTGKTIENIIFILNKTYPELNLKYSIVSFLNGMSEEKINELKQQDIFCYYLHSVPKYDYETILSGYQYPETQKIVCTASSDYNCSSITIGQYADARTGVDIADYQQRCHYLSEQVVKKLHLTAVKNQTILVLGTEECMYPGIYLGNYIETHTNNQVRFHATTRSPILPSSDKDYPLKTRYQLISLYEESRITYLYNLSAYDKVLIVTDATADTNGISTLCQALKKTGNTDITKITWRSEE